MIKEFSVLMSVYKKDRASELKQSLESVVTSSVIPSELILVIDGKLTDDLEQTIGEYVGKYNFIKVVKLPVNGGLAHALNVGLKHCTYDYIARMDSDDVTLSIRFEKQLAFMEKCPDVDCVGTWAIEIKSDGSEFFRKQMPLTHEKCKAFYMKRNPMIHPTVMFRKRFFEKAGNYPEDTYQEEDTMLWANGFANGCIFANIPEYLYKFRINEDFFNRRKGLRYAIDTFKIRHKIGRMLGFPLKADGYAILFAVSKMLPEPLLKIMYKFAR